MTRRDYTIKIVIIGFLTILFFTSIFLILAQRSNLWEKLMAESNNVNVIELISEDSKWKYMDADQEPGVGNVWTTLEYSADFWEDMDGVFQKDLSEDKVSSTIFFRYEFNAKDIAKYRHMEGNISYADAVIVYLNGSIIYTGNVPNNGYYSNQDMGASNIVYYNESDNFYITDLSELKEGKNVISVEVHRKDVDSTNMYFHFPYLRLSEIEKEEIVPDTKGLVLFKGNEWDEVEISWLTDSDKPYRIEYMEGSKKDVKIDTFSKYANSVIMGSTKVNDKRMFKNTAIIKRLKVRTDYIYRVIQIGGEKGSEIYEFQTPEKQETTFVFPGIIENKYLKEENIHIWQDKLFKGMSLSQDADYLVLGVDKSTLQDSWFNDSRMGQELLFRSPQQLKEIPVILTEYNRSQKREDISIVENQYWTYLDMLLIKLDTVIMNNEYHKEFMEEIIKQRNRKWVIVLMDTSIFEENGILIREYEKMFKELDVDIVLDGSNSYSRHYASNNNHEENVEDFIEERIEKSIGETIYFSTGLFVGGIDQTAQVSKRKHNKFEEDKPCIVKMIVTRGDIIIETYRIEDGEKIDSLHLVKD